MYNPVNFAEKYQLARQLAIEQKPEGGLCGLELEWNILDQSLHPVLTVGSGPNKQSFVDFLRAECLIGWEREYSQLEVYNWMIEWATRPYFSPRGAVYEGRLLEATLLNALNKAGRELGDRLYYWHGNLFFMPEIRRDCIPGSWNLAKRRYLERCVELYGESLATAGIHTNLSLPDPLFAWDFVHLSSSERGMMHLDDYKSQFYITATRLMRAFAALFIATGASTPYEAKIEHGQPVVALSEYDSVRNLTFPNPPDLDQPNLYRSYEDYLQTSYDLVRRGVRFGNNNWTPIRARSFAEPVERLIAITSDQLMDLYARGLYSTGKGEPMDEMAIKIERQNLLARINLPMARVEVRTDESGHPMEMEIANVTLKYLLLMRFFADPEFGRAFRYDREDIDRARRNEDLAARWGMNAEIENPFTGKPVCMRDFLRWTLSETRPLAVEVEMWEDLTPLVDMAAGAPNTAEIIRERATRELHGAKHLPLEFLRQMVEEHEAAVNHDVEIVAETYGRLGSDAEKLGDFLQRARDEVRLDMSKPVRFRPRPDALIQVSFPDKTSEVLDLAQQLVRIPSVTACQEERLDEVHRAATLCFDYARNRGLQVAYFDQEKYPALLVSFPGQPYAPVMLSGHFDVVLPEPDDSQFTPVIEGDYLVGRGAADMKTVVATNLVWMKDMLKKGPPYPPVSLALVGNEENGEVERMGTQHLLERLAQEADAMGTASYAPQILIAGERTGEKGNELWGEICPENRGVFRFEVVARGERGHSGAKTAVGVSDLTERLLLARSAITGIFGRHLTLSSKDGWQSQARFPYIQVGVPGIFNITADYGVLGAEVRPIPPDRLEGLRQELAEYCESMGLELAINCAENGIVCLPTNPYYAALVSAVREVSGDEPRVGRKLPATSARFAPAGQGVVWGQTGIGPHAKNERHFIPSIDPYYQALTRYGELLKSL